ncbi:MAG: HU family DNA-binding protein [Anaerolineae bacterium]|nr:HU family DNA-binding protein [Anaerolineae bacterium]
MNKTELVKQIARESKFTDRPLTRDQVRWVIDALFAAIQTELATNGARVEIEHFGVWENRIVKNQDRSRLAGNIVPVSEHSIVTFRTSKQFRAQLKQQL